MSNIKYCTRCECDQVFVRKSDDFVEPPLHPIKLADIALVLYFNPKSFVVQKIDLLNWHFARIVLQIPIKNETSESPFHAKRSSIYQFIRDYYTPIDVTIQPMTFNHDDDKIPVRTLYYCPVCYKYVLQGQQT
jgi:hypothetical protein